jgi:hypothetical protein
MGIIIKEMCAAGRGVSTAGSAITPGSLICRNSGTSVIPSPLSGGFSPKMFALETENIDLNYKVNSAVPYKMCHTGDQVSAFLANGEVVVVGDALCCAGNGVLRKMSSSQDFVLAVSLEALAAIGDTRITVEII